MEEVTCTVYFEKSLDVIMHHCAHETVLHQETFFFKNTNGITNKLIRELADQTG